MNDLKACPFCNGEKGKTMLEELHPEIGYDWRVRCYGCGVEVTPRHNLKGNKAKLEVIETWNTCTPSRNDVIDECVNKLREKRDNEHSLLLNGRRYTDGVNGTIEALKSMKGEEG